MFVDTPTFVIELLYPRDANYAINHRFLKTQAGAIQTSIYNVLELCGIASYRLTQDELDKLFYGFEERFHTRVLYPQVADDIPSTSFIDDWIAQIYACITRRMHFSDALILEIAERYGLSTFITWNTKHFEGKTAMRVLTPEEYLIERGLIGGYGK